MSNATLEDTILTNNDVYLTYLDFQKAFGSIDHARLLAIMEDISYSINAIKLTCNIYTNSITSFHNNHFGTMPPIQINRGNKQGDTLNPYLFIIFLDPLLKWLEKANLGYHFNKLSAICMTTTYSDDLIVITDNVTHIQSQINKLQRFYEWAHLNLNLAKCAITGCPNTSPHYHKMNLIPI